jgi:eukaryotic-like serine/threonine-protein kinase
MRDRVLDMLIPGGAITGRLFSELVGDEPVLIVLAEGTMIGPWRIGRLLGSGGTSSVYLAERADAEFQQTVALKIVRPHNRLAESFRRERRILAELRHPGIAGFVDGGETSDGLLWFAMEPIIGCPIGEYVQNQHLGWKPRLALIAEVCMAVAYAHAHQLVHRDIKPSNILVDEHGNPRLLDFGIALQGDTISGTEQVAWTPGYESPEQRRGECVTTASDIYQLGLLLRLVLLDHNDTTTQHCELPSWVRADLEAIVARAIAEDPAARYASAASLAADLAAIGKELPVTARSGRGYKITRALRRHRKFVTSAIAAVVFLAILVIYDAARLREERDLALASVRRSEVTRDFLISLFAARDPAVNKGKSLTLIEVLDRGAARLELEFDGNPDQRASMAVEIARIYEMLSEYASARRLLERQAALASRDLPTDSLAYIRLFSLAGLVAFRQGDYAIAEQWYEHARAGLVPSRDRSRELVRGALLTRMALLKQEYGDPDARQLQTQAIVVLSRALDGRGYGLAGAWNNLGLIDAEARRFPEALQAYARAAELYNAEGKDQDRTALMLRVNIAAAQREMGHYDEAQAMLYSVLALHERDRLPENMVYTHGLYELAKTKLALGEHDAAYDLAVQALALYRKRFGDGHPFLSYPLMVIAHVDSKRGKLDAALASCLEALEIRRSIGGEVSVLTIESQLDCAAVRLRRGELELAASDIDAAAKNAEGIRINRTQLAAQVDVARAELQLRRGDLADARRLAVQALAALDESVPSASWRERARLVLGGARGSP